MECGTLKCSYAMLAARDAVTRPASGRLRSMNPQRLTLITIVIAVLVVAGVLIAPRLGGAAASGEIDYAAQPVAGSPDAPVKVAVFFDFLCPHCASFSETVTPIIKREFVDTGTASLYFLNFPVVDAARSRALAVLGECVYQQDNDAFIELEPIMLRAQNELGNIGRATDIALTYAPTLDEATLRTCVNESQTADAVDADVAATRTFGLTGTPSVIVNGTVVSNPTLANVRRAIENAAEN